MTDKASPLVRLGAKKRYFTKGQHAGTGDAGDGGASSTDSSSVDSMDEDEPEHAAEKVLGGLHYFRILLSRVIHVVLMKVGRIFFVEGS